MPLAHLQDVRQGRRHQGRVARRGKRHEPDPVRVAIAPARSALNRQARLANARGAGERYQADIPRTEQPAECRDLGGAAHEGGGVKGQIAMGCRLERGRDRYKGSRSLRSVARQQRGGDGSRRGLAPACPTHQGQLVGLRDAEVGDDQGGHLARRAGRAGFDLVDHVGGAADLFGQSILGQVMVFALLLQPDPKDTVLNVKPPHQPI